MKNKIILITGATDGIGKQTAIDLANMGARLIIHGRNEESCRNVQSQIQEKTGNSDIEFISADFASLIQVSEMAKSIKTKYKKLDVLINNAGVYENKKLLTECGYESTFSINHLAHFLLTLKLIDLLKASSPSRIINVSSMAHNSFDLNNLNSEKYFEPYNAYSISKAANIMFTYKLAKDLKDFNVSVNALHPGVIATKLLYKGFSMTGASLKKGARTSLFLATSSKVKGTTGKFFVDLKERSSSSFTYDGELQNKLWEVSLQMVERYIK